MHHQPHKICSQILSMVAYIKEVKSSKEANSEHPCNVESGKDYLLSLHMFLGKWQRANIVNTCFMNSKNQRNLMVKIIFFHFICSCEIGKQGADHDNTTTTTTMICIKLTLYSGMALFTNKKNLDCIT